MTVWVSTKLPRELADKVQDLALSERRSYAQMVAMLCEEALTARKQTLSPHWPSAKALDASLESLRGERL